MIRYYVANFWSRAFDGDFLDFFIKEAIPDSVRTESSSDADLFFSSIFGGETTDPTRTIGFIYENIRPDFLRFRRTFSSDFDDFDNRNFRLPLWYFRLAWPGFSQRALAPAQDNHGFETELLSIDAAMKSRSLSLPRPNDCALIAGAYEPLRLTLFSELSKIMRMEGFGNLFRRPLRESKVKFLESFKFCLCPENSYHPGYVTEKLVDSYMAGAIPVYAGCREVNTDFNPEAFINLYDFPTCVDFIRRVERLVRDPYLQASVRSQPLFLQRPSLAPAIEFFRDSVRQILSR